MKNGEVGVENRRRNVTAYCARAGDLNRISKLADDLVPARHLLITLSTSLSINHCDIHDNWVKSLSPAPKQTSFIHSFKYKMKERVSLSLFLSLQ